MPMIPIRPDNGPLESGTVTVPTDGGWAQAREQIEKWRVMYQALAAESLVSAQASFERGCEHQKALHDLRADSAAEIAKIVAARRLSFGNPPQVAGEGFVYVIEFSTGTVKVGQTLDPKQRLSTHQAEAATFGVGIASYFISPAHENFRENEVALISFCREVSRRSRREYYHEVAYGAVVAFAQELDFRSDITNQVVVEFPAR